MVESGKPSSSNPETYTLKPLLLVVSQSPVPGTAASASPGVVRNTIVSILNLLDQKCWGWRPAIHTASQMVVIVELLSHVRLFLTLDVLKKLRIKVCNRHNHIFKRADALHFLKSILKNHVRVLPKYCISVLLLMCSQFSLGIS